jgi:hypothetical protein
MLCRKGKGKEAKLGYAGHLLMENRNGLAVSACVTQATGTAEREAGLAFAEEISGDGRVTLGGDKNYDTHDFVEQLRERQVTPHVAQNNTNRKSAIDGRTTRHDGYQISQRKRKRRDLRLAEGGRLAAQTPPSRHRARELDLHLRDGRLQPGKNEKAGDGVGSSVPWSAKRSLPEVKTNQKRIA